MPTYDYECRKCGHRFEVFHSMSDEKVRRCPKCRGRARRVPSAGAGLLFKGSGFYITDYRSKSYQDKERSEKAAPESKESKSSDSGGDSGSKSATPATPAKETPPKKGAKDGGRSPSKGGSGTSGAS